jgi:hypothetical protein
MHCQLYADVGAVTAAVNSTKCVAKGGKTR